MIVPRTGKVAYINTAPCDDCGVAIDYIRQSWYPLYPDGALCRACGEGPRAYRRHARPWMCSTPTGMTPSRMRFKKPGH
jgi:hypothetical protein